MSHKLYLMRHAQSADRQLSQADKTRELTPHGMKEALQIGAYLQSQNFFCDLFLASTAIRAKSTAEYVLEALKWPVERLQLEDIIYDASVRNLFEYVSKIDHSIKNVMIVGHNPSITYFAEYLTKAEIGDMATAGLAIIEFNINEWQEISEGSGKLVHYICPDLI